MTIPSTGRRQLKLGDAEYVWSIRRKPTYSEALGDSTMRVAVQSLADGASCVLLVDVGVPRPDNWIKPHQTAVKPAMVREMIEKALSLGWVPESSGGPFTLHHQIRDLPE